MLAQRLSAAVRGDARGGSLARDPTRRPRPRPRDRANREPHRAPARAATDPEPAAAAGACCGGWGSPASWGVCPYERSCSIFFLSPVGADVARDPPPRGLRGLSFL